MFDLKNRIAVVTGASSGLGVQFAHALADQGATVALIARRKDRLDAQVAEFEKQGKKALAVQCDVTDTNQIKNAVATIINEYGKIDILVNNAGKGGETPSVDEPDEIWQSIVNLNLTSIFTCCREFGKEMLKKGYGRIINISSMYGFVGNMINPAPAYHATKGGVTNLTRALGAEWATKGVTVNALAPGFFASELTDKFIDTPEFQAAVKAYCPMGRVGKPKELNAALIYLASDEASYTTGSIVYVDGGWTAI